MEKIKFANSYKDVYISILAKNQLEDLLSSCDQGNLAFYSDIKVSLNRIAGGEYEGIKFVGNYTWKKDLEFGGGSIYLNIICDNTYRKVAFYVPKFDFNPKTTNRKISLEEENNLSLISVTESDIKNMVMECVCRIISEEVKCDYHVGKYEVVNGWDERDITPYLYHSLKKFGWVYQVKMYFSKDGTYCLLRRKSNRKLFFAKIVTAPELGEKETKFVPCRTKEVPRVIRQDVQRFLRLHPERRGHNVIS